MGRAELRRNNKQKFTYTFDEIEAIKQEAVNKECKAMFILTFSLPLRVMFKKHGWKQKRLTDLMDEILEEYEAVQRGETTIQDNVQFVENNTGVKFEEEGEGIVQIS